MKTYTYNFPTFFKKTKQYFSVFVFFICLLLSFSLITNTVQAETIITNTATANFTINGSAKTLSDSVQFTKDTVVTATDEIILSKQANSSSVYIGYPINYTLTVNNPNSSALTNVIIQDTLPPGISLQESSIRLNNTLLNASQIDVSGNYLSIQIGNIPATQSYVVTYKAIAQSLGTQINQAYAISDTADSTKAIASIKVLEVPIEPLLLTKKASPETAKRGEIIHYTLSIDNPNDSIIENVLLLDSLPSSLSYINGSARLNQITNITANTSNGLSFPLGNIPARAKWVFSYDAKVLKKATKAIVNTATIRTRDPRANSKSAKASIEVIDGEFTITKSANKKTVQVGDIVTYNISIHNPEKYTLTNIVIDDYLPKGFIYQNNSAQFNKQPLQSSNIKVKNNSNLEFLLSSLEEGKSVSLTYTTMVTEDADLGNAKNTANAISDSANSNTASTTIIVAEPSLPIVLTKQVDIKKVKQGLNNVITFNLTINNPNKESLDNVTVKDFLPTGLTYINNSSLLNQAPVTTNTTEGLIFFIGKMPGNTVWNISYQTQVDENTDIGNLINKAKASSNVKKTNSNIATATIEIVNYHIGITKTANKKEVLPGETVTYSIKINSPKDQALTNILIEDSLPKDFTYKIGTAKIGGKSLSPSSIQVDGSHLQFSIPSLDKNTNIDLTYTVDISKTAKFGTAINTVIASSDFASSNSTSASIAVIEPSLPIILKKQANKKKFRAGDTVDYTLTINNPNKKPLSKITIKDILPSNLIYVDKSARLNGKAINASNTKELSFSLNNIPANTIWILTYKAQLNTNTKAGKLINKAKVVADDTNANSNVATSTIEVVDYQLGISKVANKKNVLPNDTVTYTIKINNLEDHTLNNIIVEDKLPTGFNYKAGSAKIGNKTLATSSIKVSGSYLYFLIDSLKKNETTSISYIIDVTDKANIGKATNIASAKSNLAQSITVSATVKVRTPSTIDFLKIDNTINIDKSVIQPTAYNDNKNGGKHWKEIKSITLPHGSTIDLPSPQQLTSATKYALSDPIVIQVTDLDQNENPEKIETVIITIHVPGTNDTEVLLLKETTKNSGIFRGALETTAEIGQIQNGLLSLSQNSKISVSYRDDEDDMDVSATAAFIIPDPQLVLTKSADKQSATIGELVKYTLEFTNTTNFDIPKVILNDLLPIGFKIIPDSVTLNGNKITQPLNKGRNIFLSLGNIKINEKWTIEYLTKISSGVQIGDAVNVAKIITGNHQSNLARATITIKDDLMRSKNILSGRVYVGCEREGKNIKVLPQINIYLETGRSVLSDKEGFWHMEGVNPGKHVLQIDTGSLPDGYEVISCGDNTRHAKNNKSQFVSLQAGSLWHVDFHVKKVGTLETQNKHEVKKKKVVSNPAKLFNQTFLESASDKFEILWPKNNYVPPVASTKIYIKSSPKHRVDVYLNGKKVSVLNYDGSDTNKTRTATIRRWLGVDIDINQRNNTLLAILKDKSGKEIRRITHNIHFSSNPDSAEFLKKESILIADGKTTPVITLRIKDEDGYPMRANTHGYFTLKNSSFTIKNLQSEDGEVNESISGVYKYQIEEGGIAHIELNPTTQSGQIKLELKFPKSNDKTITAWIKPQLREWILIGIAEGTVAHKTISGNIKTLEDLGKADKFYKKGRIAFFAKGKIKGKYLLTLAYDSNKKKHEAGYQLNGDINPDSWYTVYADNSRSQYDAPSSKKLYIKLEKDTFYSVFGDYRTEMNITELAKFERTLNGIKSEYKGRNISYNAFASETSNNHHHDEISGDGTSGLYYLSSSIIPNSEIIRIETRDRFHSERIIKTRKLIRYQDYDIDYDAGTLFFKSPITGQDSSFNPNIIVADYDSSTHSNKNLILGGRVAVKTNNEKFEVGISNINMTTNDSKNDSLVAIDATYQLTKNTKIHAEVARSKTLAAEHKSVDAQILELEKTGNNLEARVYYRKEGENFGIDSQKSEIGTQKIGAELRYKINEETTLNTQVSKQNNLSNNNKSQLAEIKLNHRFNRYELNTGIRHSKESLSKSTKTNNTFLLGGKYTTENGKFTLRGNIEKNINKNNGSERSPDRALAGLDIKLKQGLTLFFEHEISDNDILNTQNSRIGVSKSLWKGAKAKTTITQEQTDQGQRNYATLGLSQNIKLTNKIHADISLDHAKTIGTSNERFNSNEPASQGAQHDNYTAFSVGLSSNDKKWSWSTRAEIRDGNLIDRINLRAGLIRHLNNGKNLSAKLSYSDYQSDAGDFSKNTKLSLGSAWHPKEEYFTLFTRLDIADKKTFNKNENLHTQKIIHNLHYNHKLNQKTQFSIHHGIKHIVDENKNLKTHATVDTATAELRRDINERWDIGTHFGYLHDWTEENTKTVAGISIGVTPAKNTWLQFGYNVEGFDDNDFDDNNYKRKGAYLSFNYKFDQDSFRQKIKKVSPH